MRRVAVEAIPQAREDGLLIRELGDEVLVYDLDRHKAHCLNKTASLIWKQCDGNTPAAEIARTLSANQETPLIEEAVWFALGQLEKTHLLTGCTGPTNAAKSLSRRELIRRLGIAAALGLPLVTSVLAPRASEAATCKATGVVCGAKQ